MGIDGSVHIIHTSTYHGDGSDRNLSCLLEGEAMTKFKKGDRVWKESLTGEIQIYKVMEPTSGEFVHITCLYPGSNCSFTILSEEVKLCDDSPKFAIYGDTLERKPIDEIKIIGRCGDVLCYLDYADELTAYPYQALASYKISGLPERDCIIQIEDCLYNVKDIKEKVRPL